MVSLISPPPGRPTTASRPAAERASAATKFIVGEPMNEATNLFAGLVIELHRRADLRDDAVVEHHDLVGERHRLDLIVGDVDHRRLEVLVQLGDLDAHLHAQHGVEVGQRLVEEEHLRLAHQRPADGDALALAAGELRRPAVEEFSSCSMLRDFVGALLDHVLRRLGDAERERDVLAHRHVRVERVGLEHHGDAPLGRRHVGDVDAVDEDLPCGDHLEAGDHAQQRGLAAAGRPEQGAELALVDGEVEHLDCLDRRRSAS